MKINVPAAANDCGLTVANLGQSKPRDYSQPAHWYKIPEITKDVDTFYIYSTIYMGAGEATVRDIGADAQVCVARGTVVTHADAFPNEMPEFAGPESFHQDDYSIYFNNIVDNVAKRIAAYKNNNSK